MNRSQPTEFVVEVSPSEVRQRIWQIIPGALSWGVLLLLTILSFVVPFWIAIFVIGYDIYILIRIVYMSVHLLYAYQVLRRSAGINWIQRSQDVSKNLAAYRLHVEHQLREETDKNKKWQLERHLQELQRTKDVVPWEKVHHLIVLPTYDESYVVLKQSLTSIAETDYPKDKLHVVIGFEERAGEEARSKAETIRSEFAGKFATILTTFHPDGIPGEKRVKSANATWAIQHLEKELAPLNIAPEHMVVSNFDSDTVVSPEYFSYLTYTFITHPNRYRVSYQPLPVYNNNVWDAPAFSRVIATGSTFWQMIESTRPERLVTFSSHSMSMLALKDVGYWQRDIISEDSRIFWQCLLKYDGEYRTEPMYTTVSMDAALAPNWWQTLVNQYKQKRRWAWGIENFPFLMEGFIKNKKIPWSTKATYLFRTLEGHFAWATSAIIVAGLGWLPVLFGGPAFHSTVLSYSLPRITRTLMSIAMGGLIISASLSLLLLPRRPEHYSRWKYIFIILQWILVPIIATLLSAFPALDSETRLMFGRDINFNVMQKSRRNRQET